MRADNRGEGGVLALSALASKSSRRSKSVGKSVVLLSMVGLGLFFGDCLITPAISVLSAVEGLNAATNVFEPLVLPIAIVVLVLLFVFQSHGTERVAKLFGPIIVAWFLVLATLGALAIAEEPGVLRALSPYHAIALFADQGWQAYASLGAIVLAITGTEALYADMGHFGRGPIRIAWSFIVLPSLLLNYFGQGALTLRNPEAVDHLFFLMAPEWALLPLVALATCATIIASQAVISGAFSLGYQAIQLGYLPRMAVRHTSPETIGQILCPGSTGCSCSACCCWR